MKQKKMVKNNKNVFIIFLSLFVIFVAVFVGLNLKKEKLFCVDTTTISSNVNNNVIYQDALSGISIKFDYNPNWPVEPFEYNQESKEISFGQPFFGHESCQKTLDRNYLLIKDKISQKELLIELKNEYGENVTYKTINTKIGIAYVFESMNSVYNLRARILRDNSQIDIFWSGDEKSLIGFIQYNISR